MKIKEKIRKILLKFCLSHCRNNFCNYLLFKLLNKAELSRLNEALEYIYKRRLQRKLING